jgi:hypothetical protein
LLRGLLRRAGLRIDAWRSAADMWDPPAPWRQRVERIEAELRARHADEDEWQVAERQSDLIAQLLESSTIVPNLLSLRHDASG